MRPAEFRRVLGEQAFPAEGTVADRIRFLLSYAILAPSTHNSQPWRFRIRDRVCELHADPTLRLPEADPSGRDLMISLGCCLEYLAIAAARYGMLGEVRLTPAGTRVAEVVFRDPPGPPEKKHASLCDAIVRRVNVRGVFGRHPIPAGLLTQLGGLPHDLDLCLDLITDPDRIAAIAELTARGLRFAHRRLSFRREMSQWIISNFSLRRDGIPGYSLRMPALLSLVLPRGMKWFDLGALLSVPNRRSVASAPLVCVVSAAADGEEAWVRVGRFSARAMLECVAAGLQTSIFVAAIEMNELWREVQRVLMSNLRPQFLFCVGMIPGVFQPTPRHSVEEKLLVP